MATKKKITAPARTAKRPVAAKKTVPSKSAQAKKKVPKKAPVKTSKSLSTRNTRQVVMAVAVVLVLLTVGAWYTMSRSDSSLNAVNAGTYEGEILTEGSGCTEEDVDPSQIDECQRLALESSQYAVLGDNTGKMAWPIKKVDWPKLAKPIANCNLIFNGEAGKPVSPGIEIGVTVGTPVFAAYHGTVTHVDVEDGVIIVRTDLISSKYTGSKRIYYAYKHLSKVSVKEGQKIAKTDPVGLSGSGSNKGAALKNSLQFGIWITPERLGGKPKLDSAEGRKMLAGMLHPMNFMPNDRNIADCPPNGPYNLPGPAANTGSNTNPQPPKPVPANGIVFPMKTTKAKISNRSIFKNNTTSPYGHPYTAYDILVPTGTPVVAMYPGVVSKFSKDRCNTHIVGVYSSSKNIRYSYMHLKSNIQVKLGETVTPGELLGYTAPGPCGTPSHLHLDAIRGRDRLSCSRLSCSAAVKRLFVSLGPDLYSTYQKLPAN